MNAFIKKLNFLDWIISASVFAYGMYVLDLFWVLGGLLGFVFAYLKPAERFKNKLSEKFLAKKKAAVHDGHAQGIYFTDVVGQQPSKAVSVVEPSTLKKSYRQSPYQVTSVILTPSRHNLLNLAALHGNPPEKRESY